MYLWGDNRPYNSYARYFRGLFGERVQKLSVNLGLGCPNRDGTLSVGGCTFCNNSAFTPSYCQPSKSVKEQIEEGIEFHKWRYNRATKYLVYLQSFSNTYAPLDRLKQLYEQALTNQEVIGIVIGTRPDCVDEQKLDYIASLSKKYYVAVEYGIESTNNEILKSVNRGHTFECGVEAIKQTAERGVHVGAHFILGLPGQSESEIIDQTDIINTLPLTTIKFHQLQIFNDTAMAKEYDDNPEKFRFWSVEEYIDLMVKIFERLRPDIVVERFASEAPPRYHHAGNWGLVRNETLWTLLEQRLLELHTYQGKNYYICKQL